MKKSIILTACILAATVMHAQQVFNVQNGAKAEFYDNLETAVQQAAAGDTIYLPGATINLQSDLVIDKKLALIGAGWDTDSIGGVYPTVFTKHIYFKKGSDGSLLTGCRLYSNINIQEFDTIGNISILRNYLSDLHLNNRVKQVIIHENVLSNINANTASACIITNNFIINRISGAKNSVISNNVIRDGVGSNNGCTFENNYIKRIETGYANTTCQFSHNVLGETAPANDVNNQYYDNLESQDPAQIFTAWNNENSLPKGLKIQDGSPAKTVGVGGTEIGIYGGATPYKAGALPFNPHIRRSNISARVDANGKIHVDVIAVAQAN